jgi:tetratricopeptide (TPR) repeat protein
MGRELTSESEVKNTGANSASFWPATFFRKWILAFVLVLSLVAYWRTLGYPFVYDDVYTITEDPAVQSWSYLPDYFTKNVWYGLRPNAQMNYYRPVFLLWFRMNHMLFGLKPWGWHLTTVFAHLAATALVFVLALNILEDRIAAALATLLFGLHPIHVEAVAWISGVTESLVAFFLISSFLCYLKWKSSRGAWGWLALSLACYVFGLLEKETALVFFLLITCYEWVYRGQWPPDGPWKAWLGWARSASFAALPYFALLIPYMAARLYALKSFVPLVTPLPLATVVFTWPSLIWFWVQHLLWPVGLSSCYDLGFIFHPTFANFTLPTLLVLIVTALGVYGALGSRAVGFAGLWMVVFVVPVLDIRIFRDDIFAQDRYLYVPSVGFALIAGLGLRRLYSRWVELGRARAVAAAGLCALTGAMVWGAMAEGAYFSDPWKFAAQCFRSGRQYKYLTLLNAKLLVQKSKYAGAAQLYRQILTADPNFQPALSDLAFLYYGDGQYRQAVDYFTRAILADPRPPEDYLYLGLSELRLGRTYEAEVAFRRAVQLNPTGHGYHFALGVVLEQAGALPEALQQFKAERLVNPDLTAARAKAEEVEARLRNSGAGETNSR